MQNNATKPTRSERRALAILGQRLTVGDMGKDNFRARIYDLIESGSGLARWSTGSALRSWEITDAGRALMANATPKGCNYARWAEAKQPGAGRKMADILNADGVPAGYEYLSELGL